MRVILHLETDDSVQDNGLAADAGRLSADSDVSAAGPNPLALRNFLTNLNAAESALRVEAHRLWSLTEGQEGEACLFGSTFDLAILKQSVDSDVDSLVHLAKILGSLLEKEPGDTLQVDLWIVRKEAGSFEARATHRLRVALAAGGSSAEQAELRWSFGLPRVQQALLFILRGGRQRID